MPKHKFQPGNPGKPKGAVNKKTHDLRVKVNDFLNDKWPDLVSTYSELEPKDKVAFYEKLLQYGLPKLQATSLDIQIERLTDDQLDDIIQKLIEKSNAATE